MPGGISLSYVVVSLLCVSLLSFAGAGLLLIKKSRFDALFLPLYVFAFGTFAGNVFLFLLPESFHLIESEINILALVLLGILLFAMMDRLPSARRYFRFGSGLNNTAYFTLLSDGLHSWADGSVIALSYMIHIELGITTTIAIICHEIPHEVAKFSLLLHQGIPPKKAIYWSFLPSVGLFLGAVMTYGFKHYLDLETYYLLPVMAGMFFYIIAWKMLPDLRRSMQGISRTQYVRVALALLVSLILLLLLQKYTHHSHG